MQRMPTEERIILFLFQASRCIEAFLVSGADVTGDRFALRFRLGAFESNDIPWHHS